MFDTDPTDGTVTVEECATRDGNNFMFYDSDASTPATEDQAWILRRSSILHP